MLRPPPRPCTPTNEAQPPAPVAAMGTTGAVGVAAMIARFDKGGEEEHLSSSSSSASDSSSDSDDESDSSMDSSSNSDESTNLDSQLATTGVSVSTGPGVDGRPRPEPAGVDHPYYSTAAAMTAGGALGAGAVYDFEESDVQSSTSSFVQSTDTEESDSGFEPSFTTEESLEEREVPSALYGNDTQVNDDIDNIGTDATSSRSVGSEAAVIQSRGLSSDPSPASVDNEATVAKTFIDEESSLPAETEVTIEEIVSTANDDTTQASNQTTAPSTHQEEDEVSTGAVVLGAVAGSAALAAATSYALGRRDDGSEDDSNLLIDDNESFPTEAGVAAQEPRLGNSQRASESK